MGIIKKIINANCDINSFNSYIKSYTHPGSPYTSFAHHCPSLLHLLWVYPSRFLRVFIFYDVHIQGPRVSPCWLKVLLNSTASNNPVDQICKRESIVEFDVISLYHGLKCSESSFCFTDFFWMFRLSIYSAIEWSCVMYLTTLIEKLYFTRYGRYSIPTAIL